MKLCLRLLIIFVTFCGINSKVLILIVDPWDEDIAKRSVIETMRYGSLSFNNTILQTEVVAFTDTNNIAIKRMIEINIQIGLSMIIDATCEGLGFVRITATKNKIPYIIVKPAVTEFIKAATDVLKEIGGVDAAFVFQNEAEMEHGLCHVVEHVVLRILLIDGMTVNTTSKLGGLRPRHSNYVMLGTGQEVESMLYQGLKGRLMTGDSRWIAVTQDLTFPLLVSEMPKMGLIRPKIEMVCKLSSTPDQCNCYATRTDCTVKVIETYFETVLNAMIKFLTLPTSTPYNKLNSALEQVIAINKYPLLLENFEMKLNLDADILILNSTFQEKVASWSSTGGLKASNRKMRNAFRKKIRVGIIEDPPFIIKTEEGYTGFCIEILKELQRLLDFDYELVIPEDGYYGIIEVDGRWNGLVGQLARAETDMILAALSMTAERAEVIDFVTPYFDQTGIGILGRKPEKQKSLFKFMEVLKPEVWWGVLGGIVATGLCLWILDRYSPYSNRNNRQSYSQSCREFNLKESFWFVLTSFTPQGGGEVPKSLSGRVLVAGYWLFVVLILATFTANLAALLTVERMQSYVRSLEEMAQRVDFNFTVIESSSSKQYFINMAEAEEELYHAWKNITLNSGRENGKFRVWDYPIKEQYKNILKIIERSQPVSKVQEGVQRVKKNTNGHFALLTDSPKVRYLVNEDCDLTMIGEPFAEHPYGIAVTKGSTLLEELNEKVMQLQRQRFFEDRISKYWNSTKRRICDALDNSDSLTVYDLGGVFIITLVGLVIALLALSLEVWHFSKRNKSRIQAASVTSSKKENILTVFRTEAWTTSTYVKDEK